MANVANPVDHINLRLKENDLVQNPRTGQRVVVSGFRHYIQLSNGIGVIPGAKKLVHVDPVNNVPYSNVELLCIPRFMSVDGDANAPLAWNDHVQIMYRPSKSYTIR
jgi:hypothetical protein